jgi:hypothetical protein
MKIIIVFDEMQAVEDFTDRLPKISLQMCCNGFKRLGNTILMSVCDTLRRSDIDKQLKGYGNYNVMFMLDNNLSFSNFNKIL